MRQALISDIHANLEALTAVLADIAMWNVQEIVCLGDIVGYGPSPVECVDLVRDKCAWTIAGNHDAALDMAVAPGFKEYAAKVIAYHKSLLKPQFFLNFAGKKRWEWITHLPTSQERDEVFYVHGSPRDHLFEYIEAADFEPPGRPSKKVEEIFAATQKLLFAGHRHRPGLADNTAFAWHTPESMPQRGSPDTRVWKLDPAVKTAVNIGSVGQPRDGNPKSGYVIYDSEAGEVIFRRVAYDVAACRKRFIGVAALDQRLAERLQDGN
ncbi:MAG: metallophosphoesterase family protein [Planctomycetota bacterium]